MKTGELKKLLENVPDDFDFQINVGKPVVKSELEARDYKYPFDLERCETKKENYDIGWSSKIFSISVTVYDL